MFRKLSLFIIALLLTFQTSTAQAKEFGILLNDDDPYLVRTSNYIYECEWHGGDMSFWEGDEVILTNPDAGFNYMIAIRGIGKGNKAYVWCEEA